MLGKSREENALRFVQTVCFALCPCGENWAHTEQACLGPILLGRLFGLEPVIEDGRCSHPFNLKYLKLKSLKSFLEKLLL